MHDGTAASLTPGVGVGGGGARASVPQMRVPVDAQVTALPSTKAHDPAAGYHGDEGSRQRSLPTAWRGKLLIAGGDLLAAGAVAALVDGVGWLVGGIALVVWLLAGLHRSRLTLSILNDLPRLALGCGGASLAVLAMRAHEPGDVVVAGAGLLALVMLVRAIAYAGVRRVRSSGREIFPVAVVGSGATADTLLERVATHPETGLRVVGQFGGRAQAEDRPGPVPCEPLRDLPAVIASGHVRRLIVCEADEPTEELVDTLRRSRRLAMTVDVIPALYHLHGLRRSADEVWGLPLVRLFRPRPDFILRSAKRAMDVAVASVLLVLTLPLFALVATAVYRELGPRILYRQERVGLNGRRFQLLKFRSIAPSPGAESSWSIAESTDMTPVGRFIRKYSLDELPQLWNVLRGDMSLVGPRPERPEYVPVFEATVPGYQYRHRMPAGLTGLAAVSGLRGGATSIQERAYFDNLYIETWSPWLDLKILVWTVQSVVAGTGS